MSKAVLSADDFLSALAGETEEYHLPGVGVVHIRPLSFAEAQRLARQYKDDESGLILHAVLYGLAQPKLSEEHVARLQQAAAGPLSKLARRIMARSGMVEGEELENLAGGGS